MELTNALGTLLAIGGAEDKEGDCLILKEFIRLSKGPAARLVVMTAATDHPEETGHEYREVFHRLGVDDVQLVDVSSREDARSEAALKAVKEATGLFFTGGDQIHVTSLIGGTQMQKVLHQRYEKGMVIGGTSAGAAMMGNSMILGGGNEDSPKASGVRLGPGMDLLIGSMIDTHFSQRGRHGRLLTAVAHYPQDIGIGIDENTAILVKGTELAVVGEGVATIIDAGAMTYTNLPYVEENQNLALFGVAVHVLSAGHKFDLANRCPVIEGDTVKKNKESNSGSEKKQPKRKARRSSAKSA